eukprot:scpid13245/ scgid23650/ Metabotropic glutamate receptor 1
MADEEPQSGWRQCDGRGPSGAPLANGMKRRRRSASAMAACHEARITVLLGVIVPLLFGAVVPSQSKLSSVASTGLVHSTARPAPIVVGALYPLFRAGADRRVCNESNLWLRLHLVQTLLYTLKRYHSDAVRNLSLHPEYLPERLSSSELGHDIRDSCDSIATSVEQIKAFLDVPLGEGQKELCNHAIKKCFREMECCNQVQEANGNQPSCTAARTSNISGDVSNQVDQYCTIPQNPGQRGPPRDSPKAIFVLGPTSSDLAQVLSPGMSSFQVPHITFSATSATFADKTDYKYFFRFIASDQWQAAAMVDIILRFNFTHIIALASNDAAYGVSGLEFFRKNTQKHTRICIAMQDTFHYSDSRKMHEIARGMITHSNARVVILFAKYIYAKALFQVLALPEYNITDRIWIGSEAWGTHSAVMLNNPVVRTALSFFPKTPGQFDDYRTALHEDYHRYLHTLQPTLEELELDPWLLDYWQTTFKCRPLSTLDQSVPAVNASYSSEDNNTASSTSLPPCTGNESLKDIFPFPWASLAVMTGNVGIQAARSVVNANTKLLGPLFHSKLMNVTLPCVDPLFPTARGRCPVFAADQDISPEYQVYNLNRSTGADRLQNIGVWHMALGRGTLYLRDDVSIDWGDLLPAGSTTPNHPQFFCSETCRPGYERIFDSGSASRCCWSCKACAGNSISNTSNSDRCSQCQLGYMSSNARTACVKIPVMSISLTSGGVLVLLVLNLLLSVTVVITMAQFYQYKEEFIVKAMDYPLSMIILSGMLMSSITSPLLLVPPGDLVCRLSRIIVVPWPLVTTSAVLIKTLRLARIISKTQTLRVTHEMVSLKLKSQILFIAALTGVGVVLVIAFEMSMPTVAEFSYPLPNKVYYACTFNRPRFFTVTGYTMSLVAVTCLCAFRTRKLKGDFDDARYLMFASFAVAMVWLSLSLVILLSTDECTRPIVEGATYLANMLSILLCLFTPRLYFIFRHRRRGSYGVNSPRSDSDDQNTGNSCRRISIGIRNGVNALAMKHHLSVSRVSTRSCSSVSAMPSPPQLTSTRFDRRSCSSVASNSACQSGNFARLSDSSSIRKLSTSASAKTCLGQKSGAVDGYTLANQLAALGAAEPGILECSETSVAMLTMFQTQSKEKKATGKDDPSKTWPEPVHEESSLSDNGSEEGADDMSTRSPAASQSCRRTTPIANTMPSGRNSTTISNQSRFKSFEEVFSDDSDDVGSSGGDSVTAADAEKGKPTVKQQPEMKESQVVSTSQSDTLAPLLASASPKIAFQGRCCSAKQQHSSSHFSDSQGTSHPDCADAAQSTCDGHVQLHRRRASIPVRSLCSVCKTYSADSKWSTMSSRHSTGTERTLVAGFSIDDGEYHQTDQPTGSDPLATNAGTNAHKSILSENDRDSSNSGNGNLSDRRSCDAPLSSSSEVSGFSAQLPSQLMSSSETFTESN